MHLLNLKSVITILTLFGVLFYQCSTLQVTEEENDNKTLLLYGKGEDYKKEWNKVDSLEQNGLTKSALKEVVEIEKAAREDENHQQIIKMLIVKAKLQAVYEEAALQNTITDLKIEAENLGYPLKPFLHSIIAEMYWSYYEVNRWKFYNRSVVHGVNDDDISTWGLKKITEETIKHYLLSIQNIDSLQRTPIEGFNELIIGNDTLHQYRPFLFDFLAHRATDFFINEEPNITRPVKEFILKDEKYFSSSKDFSELMITTKDSLSLKFHGMKVLQSLVKFHLKDDNPSELIDIELKRLKFVKNNVSIINIDSLYIEALSRLKDKYSSFDAVAEVMYEIANEKYKMGLNYNYITNAAVKYELKEAYDICKNVIQKFPASYGAKQCEYLLSQIEAKSLGIIIEKVNLPDQAIKGRISFRNLEKVYCKLVKVDYEKYKEWNSGIKIQYEKVQNLQSVKQWEIDLKDDKDFQIHSGEFALPKLSLGFYMLLVASNENFSFEQSAVALTPFWVSNLSYLTRDKSDKVEVIIQHRETGEIIKGVKVKVYTKEYNYSNRNYVQKNKSTYVSDENGRVSIVRKKNDVYRSFYIDLFYDKDRLSTDDGLYQNNYFNDEGEKQTKTVFFTDRAIYRPGQTVYFKGIVLDVYNKESKIKKGHKTVVTFYDVNHQKNSELKLTSNEYGTYSGSFIIPNNGMNGQMSIATPGGTKYFSVEEYKRAKI